MLTEILTFAFTLGLGASQATANLQNPIDDARKTYEQLEGFKGVVVKQINKIFGTDRLPAANGFPVEPGVYLTLGANQLTIFDRVGAAVTGGSPTDTTVAAECQSGCSRSFFDPMRVTWLDMIKEGAAIGDEAPNRVLIAGDAAIPARSFVDLAYAAAESKPGNVPSMYILLNAGPGGLRARNFFLVPPGGLVLSSATNALGLRVRVKGGGQYEVSSASRGAVPKKSIQGKEALAAYLTKLDRQFPSKDAVVLEVGTGASLGDLVQVMVVTEDRFPIPILSMGDQLRR